MRDIVFLTAVAVALPVAVMHPWVGVLVWTWISIMNPHLYTWHGQELPVAAAVAIATLVGLFVTKDPRRLPIDAVTVVLFLFCCWVGLSTVLALDPEGSTEMLRKVVKIQLMVFVTLAVLYSRKHIDWFAWVVVGSLGFFGVKGGLFTLLAGGGYRVYGPPGASFISENNALALALVMTIPLMRYLQLVSLNKWIRHGLTVTMVLTAVSVFGSHSRGAFLAIAAMSIFLWWRGRRKFVLGVLMVGLGFGLLAFMPSMWKERMATIQDYQTEGSAMGRLHAWSTMLNIASDRIAGGGFDIYRDEVFAVYSSGEDVTRAAHSIYFQVLGEHGFIGLALFIGFWCLVWRTTGWVRRRARGDPETEWALHLADMCQVSLVGYAVGGAFLSLAYFDLPYNIMVLAVLARVWLENTKTGRTGERPTAQSSAGQDAQRTRQA